MNNSVDCFEYKYEEINDLLLKDQFSLDLKYNKLIKLIQTLNITFIDFISLIKK